MKLKNLSVAIALTICSATAMANTYQAEIGAALGRADNDGFETDLLNIHGEVFFEAVDTSGKPLAEAAFLQKAGNVYASYDDEDADGSDKSTAKIGVEYFFHDTIFYAGIHGVAVDVGDERENDWGITLGVTPVDGWLITTTYNDDVDYELNLESKYVTQLAGDTALNFELGYADGGDAEDIFSAALDYYFNHHTSLGIFTADQDETEVGVRARHFFNEQFSVNAGYSEVDETDTMWIGVDFRF